MDTYQNTSNKIKKMHKVLNLYKPSYKRQKNDLDMCINTFDNLQFDYQSDADIELNIDSLGNDPYYENSDFNNFDSNDYQDSYDSYKSSDDSDYCDNSLNEVRDLVLYKIRDISKTPSNFSWISYNYCESQCSHGSQCSQNSYEMYDSSRSDHKLSQDELNELKQDNQNFDYYQTNNIYDSDGSDEMDDFDEMDSE